MTIALVFTILDKLDALVLAHVWPIHLIYPPINVCGSRACVCNPKQAQKW